MALPSSLKVQHGPHGQRTWGIFPRGTKKQSDVQWKVVCPIQKLLKKKSVHGMKTILLNASKGEGMSFRTKQSAEAKLGEQGCLMSTAVLQAGAVW